MQNADELELSEGQIMGGFFTYCIFACSTACGAGTYLVDFPASASASCYCNCN
jgi:hypothetical protein